MNEQSLYKMDIRLARFDLLSLNLWWPFRFLLKATLALEFCPGSPWNVLNVSCVQTKMRDTVMHMMTGLISHFPFPVSYQGPLPFPLVAFSAFSIKRTCSQSCFFFFLSKCFDFLSR